MHASQRPPELTPLSLKTEAIPKDRVPRCMEMAGKAACSFKDPSGQGRSQPMRQGLSSQQAEMSGHIRFELASSNSIKRNIFR